MNITVNNQPQSVSAQTISSLIEELSLETNGVAIALNNKVIPRSEWSVTPIAEEDKIIVVSAVFGG
ncbi:MAG: sulfur carrier protein ThiS [Rikenellaceae bacterium]